jgi:hypothetical protein
LIREDAIREPYGKTSATLVPGADRILDAADVISSSKSRKKMPSAIRDQP